MGGAVDLHTDAPGVVLVAIPPLASERARLDARQLFLVQELEVPLQDEDVHARTVPKLDEKYKPFLGGQAQPRALRDLAIVVVLARQQEDPLRASRTVPDSGEKYKPSRRPSAATSLP